MTRLQPAAGAAFLIAGRLAYADSCAFTVEANDMMQYNTRELSVPASCSEIKVTLKHSGKLQAKVMGHDWVLARTSDVSAIVSAGMAAGPAHGYLPTADRRVIAATPIVGGGESTTIQFGSSVLAEGTRYTFFCTAPGHATVMRGRFIFGDAKRVARTER